VILPAAWRHKGIEHIFAKRRETKDILKFLEETEVRNRKSEKEVLYREEERDELWVGEKSSERNLMKKR
jgi:hypothetical protein